MGKLGVAGYAGFFFAKCIEQGSRLAGLTYWARPGHFASKQLGGIGIGGRSVGTQEAIAALHNAYTKMEQILSRTKKSCHELGTVTSEHATLVTETLRIRVFSRRLATIRLILHGFANSVMADLPTSGWLLTLEGRQEGRAGTSSSRNKCTFGKLCKPVSALTFIQGCAVLLLVHWPVWICSWQQRRIGEPQSSSLPKFEARL